MESPSCRGGRDSSLAMDGLVTTSTSYLSSLSLRKCSDIQHLMAVAQLWIPSNVEFTEAGAVGLKAMHVERGVVSI